MAHGVDRAEANPLIGRLLTQEDALTWCRDLGGTTTQQGYASAIRAAVCRWGFAGVSSGETGAQSALVICPWSAVPPTHPLGAGRALTIGGEPDCGEPTRSALPADRTAALLFLHVAPDSEPKELIRVLCRELHGRARAIDACGTRVATLASDLTPSATQLRRLGFDRVRHTPGRYRLDLGQTVAWRPRRSAVAIGGFATRRPVPAQRNSVL